MAGMKPETKIARIVEQMKPLVTWYERNKPAVDTIRLSADDFDFIKENETAAIVCGVYNRNGEFTYGRFKLRRA